MARNKRLPDFELDKKRSGALSRVLMSLLGWGAIFFVLLAGAGAWAYMAYSAPGPLKKNAVVTLPAGAGRAEIATILADNGVIADARIMSAASLVQSMRGATLKPGEYVFRRGMSMSEVFNTIASGRIVQHKVTIPEGWTSAMAVARINAHAALTGEVTEIPPEGALVANTMLFPRGKDRKELVDEMVAAQAKLVDDVWAKRPPDSVITSKEAMVTLASIVEKETGVAAERPLVAAVFINRLKAGMRLQSDPTIIYGIVGGKGRLDRPISRSDIDTPTPYNTYTINGLPPGPIATPGKEALEAVLNPAKTRDLYFVADGTGGHAFAETLDQHNENVKRWREVEARGGVVVAQSKPDADPAENELAELDQLVPVVQPTLPAVEMPAPTPQSEPAAAALEQAAQEMQQAEPVPAPDAGVAGSTAVATAEQPAEAAAVSTNPPSQTIPLEPGTVMKFGNRLVPIPALKQGP